MVSETSTSKLIVLPFNVLAKIRMFSLRRNTKCRVLSFWMLPMVSKASTSQLIVLPCNVLANIRMLPIGRSTK
eukprot:4670992-Karenia_brevis.AAC.1